MSPSKKYHHSRFWIRTLPIEKSGVIISFKRSSLWPADPKPPIRRPTIHSHWSIHIIALECFVVPILKCEICIFSKKWIFTTNGYLPKSIPKMDFYQKWICFKIGYFDGKLDIFEKNWAGKFLLISHNMTRVWSF